jgi:ankyrin repeat protein
MTTIYSSLQQSVVSNFLHLSSPLHRVRYTVATVSSMASALLPEEVEGENSQPFSELFDPRQKSCSETFIQVLFSMLSNDLANLETSDQFYSWFLKTHTEKYLRNVFRFKIHTVLAFCYGLLEYVIDQGRTHELRLLIDAGIDKSLITGGPGGRLLLHAFLVRAEAESVSSGFIGDKSKPDETIWMLLEHNVNINLSESEIRNTSISRFDVEKPPMSFMPPMTPKPFLHLAAELGLGDVTQRLLQKGAHLDRMWCRETALFCAIRSGQHEIVHQLVTVGANVDSVQTLGISCIDWAILNENEELYKVLHVHSRIQPRPNIPALVSAAKLGDKVLDEYVKGWGSAVIPELLGYAIYHCIKRASYNFAIATILRQGVVLNSGTLPYDVEWLIWKDANGNQDVMHILLHNAADDRGISPLVHKATIDLDFLSLSLRILHNSTKADVFKRNVLRNAVRGGYFEAVKLLVYSGVDINYLDEHGNSLLHTAFFSDYGNRNEIIKYLMHEGAEINMSSCNRRGWTLLHCAVRAGSLDNVKYFTEKATGAIQFCNSCDGPTLLEVCFDYVGKIEERVEIFKYLLGNGARINGSATRRVENWNSVLTNLIMLYHWDIVAIDKVDELIRLALDAGADIHCLGSGFEARSPIQAAAEVGNIELVKDFVCRGVNVNAPAAPLYGRTTLQAACNGGNGNLHLVQYLLDQGADVNAIAGDERGLTALQGAAIQGNIKVALLLLQHGADINAPPAPRDGRTPLEGAAEHGRLDMVKLILNAKAESGRAWRKSDDRAVVLARERGHYVIAELLESESTDVNGGEAVNSFVFQEIY